MLFFKKHPNFIKVVIWLTIIGFVAAYIPLLFVQSDEPFYENTGNSDYPPLSQEASLTPIILSTSTQFDKK